jgi:hypothetical protein
MPKIPPPKNYNKSEYDPYGSNKRYENDRYQKRDRYENEDRNERYSDKSSKYDNYKNERNDKYERHDRNDRNDRNDNKYERKDNSYEMKERTEKKTYKEDEDEENELFQESKPMIQRSPDDYKSLNRNSVEYMKKALESRDIKITKLSRFRHLYEKQRVTSRWSQTKTFQQGLPTFVPYGLGKY